MKKFAILLVVVGLAILVAYVTRTNWLPGLFERGATKRLASNAIDELPDGLHVSLCGAGGPLAAPRASGPCVVVVAGDRLYVVDAGTNGVRNIGRMGYRAGDIEAVFLTHFHSDHIDGLGETGLQRWVGAAHTSPLPVYGASGVAMVVDGFNTAYSQDFVYRNRHHGDSIAPLSGAGMIARSFELDDTEGVKTILDSDGVRVQAISVDHAPVYPAVAYKFEYKGRSLLISGDTAPSPNLEQHAQGVDLLVHEALAPNLVERMHNAAVAADQPIIAKIATDIPDYHTSPKDAAGIAARAGVGHLLYYHIVPPLAIPGQEAVFLDGAEDIFEHYTIGYDGTTISLPANSTEINIPRARM